MYPMVWLKSSKSTTFIVTCPNLRLECVWVKPGLLQFNNKGLDILRTGKSKSERYCSNQIMELSIEEDHNWHQPAIQDLFTEGIFRNVMHLSWTSFDPMAGSITYDEMFPSHSRSSVQIPMRKSELSPNWTMPNKLTTLTLDFQNRSHWLGFLCNVTLPC